MSEQEFDRPKYTDRGSCVEYSRLLRPGKRRSNRDVEMMSTGKHVFPHLYQPRTAATMKSASPMRRFAYWEHTPIYCTGKMADSTLRRHENKPEKLEAHTARIRSCQLNREAGSLLCDPENPKDTATN